jgi:hypothetical protein
MLPARQKENHMATQNEQANATTGNGSFQLAENRQNEAPHLKKTSLNSISLADAGAPHPEVQAHEDLPGLTGSPFVLFACIMALVITKYKLRHWLMG